MIRVRRFLNPSIERSVVTTDVFHVAEGINTTAAGTLEIIEKDDSGVFVRQAYSHGNWIDAEVVR